MDQRSFSPVEYRLGVAAVRRRALAVSLLGSLALVAPGALIAVLVAGQGAFGSALVVTTALLLLALAAVRAAVAHGRLVRQLSRFDVRVDPEVVVVRAGARVIELREGSLERIVEISGTLGGLRLNIAGGESRLNGETVPVPARIDVPRGGDAFAELVRALHAFAPEVPFDPPRRRSQLVRLARGALLVATLFFLPFFAVDFLHRSRIVAYGAALLVFVIVRAALRPSL